MQRVPPPGIGKSFPFSRLAEFEDGWAAGRFACQAEWVEEVTVASRIGRAEASYRTEDGETVYRLSLEDVRTSDGIAPPEYRARLDLPHSFVHLVDGTEEPFRPGDPILAVVEHGEVMKLIHVDEQGGTTTVLVDEAIFGGFDESQPLAAEEFGFPFKPVVRSWSALRPWALPIVLAEVCDPDDPEACVFRCGSTFRVEDGGYTCEGDCASDLAADALLVKCGKVPAADVWQRFSDLENDWLLAQAVEAVAA